MSEAAVDSPPASDAVQKVTFFGIVGAVGCLLGAILGEPLYALIPRPAPVAGAEVDVLFVLDVTGSMQPQIDGVRRGIVDFAKKLSERDLDERIGLVAYRDEVIGEPAQVLSFKDGPFTDDYADFASKVGQVYAEGGGDGPESSYDALRLAAQQSFRPGAAKVLLLITDAPPKFPDKQTKAPSEVIAALSDGKISQLHLIINGADRAVYTELQGNAPGEVFDLNTVASGSGGFDRVLPRVGEKIAEATVKGLASNAAIDVAYAPRQLAVTSFWTALLAIGVAVALIAGQNHYLHKPPLSSEQGLVGVGGGLAVGLVAGFVGQFLGFIPQFLPIGEIPVIGGLLSSLCLLAGMLIGWALLGGLLGRGLAFFVPNLGGVRAFLGGGVGGAVAAIGFVMMSLLAGDLLGRLLGAAILGFFIGIMIALIEAATRDFYLEVRYGQKETVKVSLGATPVTVGSNGRMCTVYAMESPRPMMFKYWLDNGQVHLLDYSTEKSTPIAAGDARALGNVTLTVRGGTAKPAPGTPATPGNNAPVGTPKAPPPPPPIRGAAPPPPAAGAAIAPPKPAGLPPVPPPPPRGAAPPPPPPRPAAPSEPPLARPAPPPPPLKAPPPPPPMGGTRPAPPPAPPPGNLRPFPPPPPPPKKP